MHARRHLCAPVNGTVCTPTYSQPPAGPLSLPLVQTMSRETLKASPPLQALADAPDAAQDAQQLPAAAADDALPRAGPVPSRAAAAAAGSEPQPHFVLTSTSAAAATVQRASPPAAATSGAPPAAATPKQQGERPKKKRRKQHSSVRSASQVPLPLQAETPEQLGAALLACGVLPGRADAFGHEAGQWVPDDTIIAVLDAVCSQRAAALTFGATQYEVGQ